MGASFPLEIDYNKLFYIEEQFDIKDESHDTTGKKAVVLEGVEEAFERCNIFS